MSKPRTQPTLDSLKARCVMAGDCWLWQGYLQNNTPQVVSYADGTKRMVSVRRLLRELIAGHHQPAGHYSNICGDPRCVSPAHTVWRGEKSHMRQMSGKRKVGPGMVKKLREYRQRTGQTKLDESKAQAIRMSDEPGPVLAARYGINKSLVNKIKRGQAWRDVSTPWEGLMP